MEKRELIFRLALVFMGAGLVFLALHDSMTMRAFNLQVEACPRAIAWVADSCSCDLNAVLTEARNKDLCTDGFSEFCEGILQDNTVYPAK